MKIKRSNINIKVIFILTRSKVYWLTSTKQTNHLLQIL